MLSGHLVQCIFKNDVLVHLTDKADWCYCKNQHDSGHKRLSFLSHHSNCWFQPSQVYWCQLRSYKIQQRAFFILLQLCWHNVLSSGSNHTKHVADLSSVICLIWQDLLCYVKRCSALVSNENRWSSFSFFPSHTVIKVKEQSTWRISCVVDSQIVPHSLSCWVWTGRVTSSIVKSNTCNVSYIMYVLLFLFIDLLPVEILNIFK